MWFTIKNEELYLNFLFHKYFCKIYIQLLQAEWFNITLFVHTLNKYRDVHKLCSNNIEIDSIKNLDAAYIVLYEISWRHQILGKGKGRGEENLFKRDGRNGVFSL